MLADLGPSIVETAPEALLIAGALVFVFVNRQELKGFLGKTTRISIGVVEFEREVAAVKDAAPVDVTVDDPRARAAVARLGRGLDALRGFEVLWVNDRPDDDRELRKVFRRSGIRFTLALDNAAAENALVTHDFDLVVTDIGRVDGESGMKLALKLVQARKPPVVLYVLKVENRPIDPRIVGITNDPAELIHYVLDVAERQ